MNKFTVLRKNCNLFANNIRKLKLPNADCIKYLFTLNNANNAQDNKEAECDRFFFAVFSFQKRYLFLFYI